MFFVSWSVSVFFFSWWIFQPLSNRSNAKNIAREKREEENIHTEELLYLPIHHPPQQKPILVHGDIIQVRERQTADRCSPMGRWLVCSVCLEASRGLDVLRAQGGGGFPWKLIQRTRHGCGHAARCGEEGQLEKNEQLLQITSGWRPHPVGR